MLQQLLYTTSRTIIRIYAQLMLRMDIQWEAPLPAGPKLIIANHPSCTDPALLGVLSPEPIQILITENPFTIPVFGSFLRRMGHIPVIADNGRAAFDEAVQVLEMGRSVAIFPEGWVSPQEGGCNPFHTGAARLALSTGVPVIPVGIYLPRERNLVIASNVTGERTVGYWYVRGPYHMTVGQALRFEGDVGDRSRVAMVTENMLRCLTDLALESERRMKKRRLSPVTG